MTDDAMSKGTELDTMAKISGYPFPTPPPSPPLTQPTVDASPAAEARAGRVAHSYPFIAVKRHVTSDTIDSDRDLGRFGEQEGEELDPLLLRSKVVAAKELGRTESLKRRLDKKHHRLIAFYKEQNERIGNLLKPLVTHAQENVDSERAHAGPVRWAIRLSLIANCLLLVIQLYAAISSLSLSFFASAIDAIFDPIVTILIFIMGKKAARADPLKWPAGGGRLVTIGNIVYAAVMASASLVLIVESVQELATHTVDDTFHLEATICVSIAFLTKISLCIYCYTLRTFGDQVNILYQDHRNDMFLNGFALFTNAAGAKLVWYIDPLGAIIISICLIYLWGGSCITDLKNMAGRAAPARLHQLVIYKAMTFSDSISQIDSCKVYSNGTGYVAEIDVVMPAETPLWKSHDVGQILQDQLEALPQIDRCYVHIDWETSHAPASRNA